MSETLFEVSSVNKIFGVDEATVHALNDVNLHLNKGEFTAFVGPSGSGKSTLLNVMSGLDTPTSGVVKLKGQKVSAMSGEELSKFRRDHIGFIFQAYNLIPVLTVKENIEYVMMLQGESESERKKRVADILTRVGLTGMEERFPSQLSGGQQQRVAVARAIVSRPDIILADEPTANLDSKTGSDLITMMEELNNEYGVTFIFSTHDPKIMSRARRLIALEDGKIISDEVR